MPDPKCQILNGDSKASWRQQVLSCASVCLTFSREHLYSYIHYVYFPHRCIYLSASFFHTCAKMKHWAWHDVRTTPGKWHSIRGVPQLILGCMPPSSYSLLCINSIYTEAIFQNGGIFQNIGLWNWANEIFPIFCLFH